VSLFFSPLINKLYVSIQVFDQFNIIVLVAFGKLLISSMNWILQPMEGAYDYWTNYFN
jgi:hypothetical protein